MQVQVSLKIDLSASAGLTHMEQKIQEAGQEAMREALKQALRKYEEQAAFCPRCGATDRRVEGTVKRVIATLFGRVQFNRRRFRCQHCLHRWCPAQRKLAELGVENVSRPLQEAAVLAGASWPYRVAAQLLSRLSGAQISPEEIRRLTNRKGEERAKVKQQQAEERLSQATEAQACSPSESERLVVGLDGGWICSREQRGGMEGKVAVIATGKELLAAPLEPSGQMTWYELSKYMQTHRHRPVRRSCFRKRTYLATFAPSSVLGACASQAVRDLGWESYQQVVVADGAQWIKQETDRHFPYATRILDWPHLWRTIRKAIRAVAIEGEYSASWRQKASKQVSRWLWKGEVGKARQRLCAWQAELPAGNAHKALSQAITYLDQQRDWIGSYEQWKREGYPVGSGIIERAVALVINRRMKKRGMRWCRANATAIVALRTDLLNEDWITPQRLRVFP